VHRATSHCARSAEIAATTEAVLAETHEIFGVVFDGHHAVAGDDAAL
jgi:hypothetical protein